MHFFKLFLSLFFFISICSSKIYALNDTIKSPESLESAASQGEEDNLESKIAELSFSKYNTLKINKLNNYSTREDSFNVPNYPQKLSKNSPKIKQKSKVNKLHKSKSKPKSRFWSILKNIIELDWLMVGIVSGVGLGLIVLLWFLLKSSLSFFQMLLFAIGFGATVFFYLLANSENDAGGALYEFFIKFGIFAWPGILAVIAGFAGLFGSTGGSFLVFLLIGLILGGLSFLLSLFLKRSFLHDK